MKALCSLENISALKPAASEQLKQKLFELKSSLFSCDNPSHTSVKEQLRFGPVHECGLSPAKSLGIIMQTEEIKTKACEVFVNLLNEKISVFMNPVIRERLKQGESEPIIKTLLGYSTLEDLKNHIIDKIVDTPETVSIINKYLKRITVKQVRLSDFKPSMNTIESEQIPIIAGEFEAFLKGHIKASDTGDETLPMIRIE